MKTKIIVIVGPTAVGKTSLSIEVAHRFNGEVISGDSQQVYQTLNIGTAKITEEEQEGIPHYLLDVRHVTENYSAFDFVNEAKHAIQMIVEKGKTPIIVGGTGLYIQSLLEGYHLGGSVSHDKILDYRKELDTWTDEALIDKVVELGIKIPQINRRRAIRALEKERLGGNFENQPSVYHPLLIGLNDDRQKLYERINDRVDTMLEMGLLDEARWLYENHPTVQASRGIGYKELFPYFAGEQDLDETVNKLKQNTRHFAKRQLTWFRNRMEVEFYQVSNSDYKEKIMESIEDFLND